MELPKAQLDYLVRHALNDSILGLGAIFSS